MFLLKVFLVAAVALAGKGRGRGGGRGGRGTNECKDLDDDVMAGFLIDTQAGDGLIDKLETSTLYCTLDARYTEFPGCPVADSTESPTPGDARRNLKKSGRGQKVKYNRARFTMSSGTSSYVQVEDNQGDEAVTACYYGDDLRMTVVGSSLDTVDAAVGRRLLKKGGGSKVTATVQMEQVGTCDIAHTFTCSIPRGGLQAVDGECNAVSVHCETDKDSDARVKMTCYENENDVKGWENAEDCSTGNAVINLSVDISP